ncbi:endospore germination permease [Bacillus sp. CGMCC 1.16607]|uniref:GerAB/ArcD/ProY family transporter n=1 Tax=Bacillus sp. CGMCC 1.16607 TaxID=3351842 RepID=UPI003638DBD8
MLEKGRISSFQMAMMLFPAISATAVLIVPGVTGRYAENDMWLSPIIASILGFITVYIAWKLHNLYPNQTVIQYSEKIFGKICGKMVGFLYVLFCIQISGIIVREYSEFIKFNILFNTPTLVVSSSIIFLGAFAVRGGIEVIARIATVFTPLFIFPFILLLLLIPDLDMKNFLPFLENGMLPVIKGAVVPQSWFSEFFLMSFIIPFVSNKGKLLKTGMVTTIMVLLCFVYMNFIILTLLGGSRITNIYPVLTAFRYIEVVEFFENFEAAIIAIWVLGNFVKLSVFLYVSSLAFSQWINLSTYRPMVFVISILIILFSYWGIPNYSELEHFIIFADSFFLTLVQTFIPLILLIIALIRKSKGENT